MARICLETRYIHAVGLVVEMKYSPLGSDELCSWAKAAKCGGTTPDSPSPGDPRIYNVDAWLDVEGQDPIKVTGVWMSEMPEGIRKPFLKELGLPVKKSLIYKEIDGTTSGVIDIKITDVWDGWCNVAVRLDNGSILPARIHSMYFAEMNSGAAPDASRVVISDKPKRRRTERNQKPKKVDGMPLAFFVFDLESTDKNYKTAEICEMAALKVVGGEVVDRFETLVFIDGEFKAQAAQKNHMSKDMLEDAPHMTAALKGFLDFIGDDAVLVGHSVKRFDLPFIKRVADLCDAKFAYREAIDTLDLAKRAWPNLPSYNMDDLRTWLDLDQDGSHRALKDCRDEYELYMRIRKEAEEGRVSIEPPKKGSSRPGAKWSGRWGRKKAKDFATDRTEFDESHPLFGKNVVLSGDIEGIEYNDCLQTVCDLGGHPQDDVTKKTDYLVVGENPGKNKIAKAEDYKGKGQNIEIIDAAAFIEMIS